MITKDEFIETTKHSLLYKKIQDEEFRITKELDNFINAMSLICNIPREIVEKVTSVDNTYIPYRVRFFDMVIVLTPTGEHTYAIQFFNRCADEDCTGLVHVGTIGYGSDIKSIEKVIRTSVFEFCPRCIYERNKKLSEKLNEPIKRKGWFR